MILPPSVLLLDMAGPLEMLRIAQQLGAPFTLHVVAPTAEVTTSLGIQITGLEPLPGKLIAGDLIIIPGVLDETVYQGKVCREIVKFLKGVFDPAQHQIMNICSGVHLKTPRSRPGWSGAIMSTQRSIRYKIASALTPARRTLWMIWRRSLMSARATYRASSNSTPA